MVAPHPRLGLPDVFAGASQIWMTVSPSDMRCLIALAHAGVPRDMLENLTPAEHERVLAGDPVACATTFQAIIQAIVRNIFRFDVKNGKPFAGDPGAFGRVLAWFCAVEEQV
jgi:hypothetical protein